MLKPYKSFIFFWKIARHELYIIFPISTFMVPYIACLLYLGANTIWYLHLHLLCDKLCTSFIDSEPPIRYLMWLPDHHHSNTGCSFFFYKYFLCSPSKLGVLSCLFGANKNRTRKVYESYFYILNFITFKITY